MLHSSMAKRLKAVEYLAGCLIFCRLLHLGYMILVVNINWCMSAQVPQHSVRKSDMLPDGWNDAGGGVYSLIYQRIEQSDPVIYLLKVVGVKGMLHVHLLVSESETNT